MDETKNRDGTGPFGFDTSDKTGQSWGSRVRERELRGGGGGISFSFHGERS